MKFLLKWNTPANCWVVDMSTDDGNPVARGIPLVTGANLLEQYGYLGLGGQMFAQTDNNVDAVPTFANLGTTGHFYFTTP